MNTRHAASFARTSDLALEPLIANDFIGALEPDPPMEGKGEIKERFLISRWNGALGRGIINPGGDIITSNNTFFLRSLRVSRRAGDVHVAFRGRRKGPRNVVEDLRQWKAPAPHEVKKVSFADG